MLERFEMAVKKTVQKLFRITELCAQKLQSVYKNSSSKKLLAFYTTSKHNLINSHLFKNLSVNVYLVALSTSPIKETNDIK